ncbi:uncharacterized protein P884DRAFT_194912 [Thermothelomyces heterothallicus CBS 202.75]|uniref:uncharacterized protein n=1 Tax=Thermothelomyces heterothallicus CBS 202.75 TaxID=1149848 RepID=UPI0037446B77
MVKLCFISALVWAAGLAVATPSPAPLVNVRTRNLPGMSDEDTVQLIWRRIAHAAHIRRENVFKNSTSLEKSWNDAELITFTYTPNVTDTKLENTDFEASLEVNVKCETCYFKAGASVALTIDGEFDFGDAFRNVTGQFIDEAKNLTDSLVESLDDVIHWGEIRDLFTEDDFELDEFINFDGFDVDTDFDIDLPPLPAVNLLFQIDHLDLYVALDTTISGKASLTIPLYKSQSPVGITIAPGLEAGIFATMDLLLSAEAEMIIRSGFHLQLPDPVGFHIALFGKNVSSVIFVAEFLTNITGGAEQAAKEGCAIKIVQEYTLALGAGAGATIAVGSHSWGVQPTTSVPIFYTTLADVCAVTADAPKPTSPPAITTTATTNNRLVRRERFTALVSSELFDPEGDEDTPTAVAYTSRAREFHTGITCASEGLAVCPQSLLRTTVLTTTKTYVTTVPTDAEPSFPRPTADTVPRTIPFGKNVNKLAATTGVPVSYVPPPPSSSTTARTAGHGDDEDGGVLDDIGDVLSGKTGGVSNKLIIGLCVGLGVPILAAAIASLIHCIRRRRYAPLPRTEATKVEYTGAYQSPMAAEREAMVKKSPDVSVSEARN